MRFMEEVWWLLQRELVLEWRSRMRIMTMFFFIVLVLAVFGFSLHLDVLQQRKVMPGVLWSVLALAGTIGLGQLYTAELEDGGLAGLRMAPIAHEALFLAKHLAFLLFLFGSSVITLALSMFMFQALSWSLFWQIVPLLFIGCWGFSIIGVVMATLLLQTRSGEALLPLLFLPLVLPLLIAGAKATAELVNVDGLVHTMFWARGMLLFDLLFFVVGLWLFPLQMEQ